MTISVIVPLYNGKRYIGTITGSLARNKEALQNGSEDEVSIDLVFVNDSPDDQISIKKIEGLNSRVVCHEMNEGIHRSRVDGLEVATGDYIVFLDQDDTVSDDYLLSQIGELRSTDADWVISNGVFRTNRKIYPDEQSVADILDDKHYFTDLTEIISPGQVLMKRSIIPDIWIENTLKNNYCDDAFLWLLLKNNGNRLAYNERTIYFHNEDGGNTSFSWKRNADALRELKDTVISIGCLNAENLELFIPAIDKEIIKQESYGRLEELYAIISARKSGGRIRRVINGRRVVIYGYGIWGRRLYDLFTDGGVCVEAVTDRNISGKTDGVGVCHPDNLPERLTDAYNCLMIITPLAYYDVITEEMRKKGIRDYLSIMDFFEEILRDAEDTD